MLPSLGRIPYLNTEPFFGDDPVRAEARTATPRAMIDLVRGGQVDVAPLPIVAAFDHPDLFVPVGDMGIATQADAKSVLLFSQVPPADLGGRCIGVIDDTATSARLLSVLLQRYYAVGGFRLVPLDAPADAILLIGDRALLQSTHDPRYRHVTDLAAAWHEWTGLPFVFAAWMQRAGVAPANAAAAVDYLDRQLTINLADLGALAARRPDCGLDAAAVRRYLQTFEYRFGPRAWAAVDRFRELDAQVSVQHDAA